MPGLICASNDLRGDTGRGPFIDKNGIHVFENMVKYSIVFKAGWANEKPAPKHPKKHINLFR